ncbi:MAG: hypothetical protein ACYS7Y_36495 [Planctomycetota bacterium]
MESPRKPATSGRLEPVVYDVSIFPQNEGFILRVREDDEITLFRATTLPYAQAMALCLEPDVYEGPDVPWSVFFPSRKVADAVA